MAAVLETAVGAPAVLHQAYAGDCINNGPSLRCMEIGLNPETGFDCSGLILYGLAEVMGCDLGNWTGNQRHVRDWWPSGSIGSIDADIYKRGEPTEPTAGDLLVFSRLVSIGKYAGHVGIVTAANKDSVQIIHTHQNEGIVHKSLIRPKTKSILGIMRIN